MKKILISLIINVNSLETKFESLVAEIKDLTSEVRTNSVSAMQTEPPFRNFASDVDFEGNRPTPFKQFTANPQVVPRSMSCRKCGHHQYNSGSRCPANQKRCLHCGEFCHFRSVCYNLRR